MGLDFANLPLVEVSVRLYFASDFLLSLAHGTSAQAQLTDRFPHLLDLEQMEPGLGGRPLTLRLTPGAPGFSHMGFRYAGNAKGLELCLQPNLLSIRWSKKFEPDPKVYPRFSAIEDNLWWADDILRKVLQLPSISALNMRYANFIPTDEKSTGSVLRDYFSETVSVALLKDVTMLHNVDLSWRESDQIDRRFSLSKGISGDGMTNVEGFLLATVAGTEVSPETSARSRLVEIHDFLQTFFTKLISTRAKKEWGFVE